MGNHPIIDSFAAAGQSQVFAYFDSLSAEEQQNLLAEAEEVDLAEIAELTRTLLQDSHGGAVDLSDLSPAPYQSLPDHGGKRADWDEAKSLGEAALRAGRVALFTVAGGQGTRLGYDGPKGTFPVTPVLRKTLFHVFAEKVLAAGVRYGKPLHWFIMTSHANHEATESFFVEHKYFGLAASQVHLFRQGRMPAVDPQGKIMLVAKDAMAMSPDGHGGSLRALARSGSLDLMEREGIDIISYFQVDNPLVRCIDPSFVGWHVRSGSEMSSKMIPKAYPGEKVGHFCAQRESIVVVEYSDLPKEMQEETDERSGQLRYIAGSIAIHLLDRAFVRRMAQGEAALPFHRADKKIPTLDSEGKPFKPEKPNGVKFEMFVFDALPFAKNPLVIETKREDDFSPVKNAEGVDSAATCADDQKRQFARWLIAQGADLQVDATGLPAIDIEVAPTFGYDEDSFAAAWAALTPKPSMTDGLVLA